MTIDGRPGGVVLVHVDAHETTEAQFAGIHEAGVAHVSIANPSPDSPLGYYRGKAQVEELLCKLNLSYSVLRPTVIFGNGDILINNIAWFVRHFPAFAIPGDGRYRIRPIFVEDMARLIANAVGQAENQVRDAVGQETYTFKELVKLIADELGRRTSLLHVPTFMAYLATRLAGWFVGDVVLTWEEYRGLLGGLLAPEGPSSGQTCFGQWLAANREHIGKRYASEIARHYVTSPMKV